LQSFFNSFLGGNEVNRPKPDPEMIEVACRRLALLPHQIVYVGDTVTDMIMAKKAGAGLAVGSWAGRRMNLFWQSKPMS